MHAYAYLKSIQKVKRTIGIEYKFHSSGENLTWLAEYLIPEC